MEFDHELSIRDLAVRVLGLVHMNRLYLEIGCPDDDVAEDLNHAALVLCERLIVEA